MTVPVVEYVYGSDKQWYVRLKGANGEIMMSSEGYTRKSSAVRASKRIAKAMSITFREGTVHGG